MKTYTKKQIDRANQLFHAVCAFHRQHGRAPTVRELVADEPGFKSSSSIVRLLNTLVEWGWIKWSGHRRGTMVITRPTERIFYAVRKSRR